MNKKLGIVCIVLFIMIILLEILPSGAVLNFAKPPSEGGGTTRVTTSYFDLLPFGYANFGPLLTAVLSCASLILSIANFLTKNSRLLQLLFVCNIVAVVTSLMPLFLGTAYFSVIGVCISVLLTVNAILIRIYKKTLQKGDCYDEIIARNKNGREFKSGICR